MQHSAPAGSQESVSTGSGQDRSVVMRQLEAVGNYVVIFSPALTESRTFSLHLSHFSHLSRENSSLLIAQVCHFVYLGCFLLKL